ncbi:MAG: hypothetical protein KA974_05835 [Saprospiraceae bacterium]|nr:hypothetical protein [Saprospiraceae bacterium]MBP7699824.1 hypothetical protein [Saprospiraceae bacterium]
MRLIFCLIINCFCLLAIAHAQPLNADSTLPKVFLSGDHEEEYNQLCLESKLLLEVCNNDVDIAYAKWYSMLLEMEAYADQINFDLKGAKMFINVFWNPDGSFLHIVYQLKPNSRNMNVAELNAFFSSFMNNYKFPLVTNVKYVNYGAASFPVNPQRVGR